MTEIQLDFPHASSPDTGNPAVLNKNMIQLRPYEPSSGIQDGTPLPNYIAPSVKEIDFDLLHEQYGTRVIFIDLDNTLTKVGSNRVDDLETVTVLKNLREKGSYDAIYIATRSGRSVKDIEQAIGAKKFEPPSGLQKPSTEYFEALLQEADCKPQEAMMVGDRVTHDISGAGAMGILTVLVNPIGKGILKGWIPTDFLGTYQKETKARHSVTEELRKLGQQ